jgi:hypothetical protein
MCSRTLEVGEFLHQESVCFANIKTDYTHRKSCMGTCSLCKGITLQVRPMHIQLCEHCDSACWDVCGFSVKWGLQVLVAAAYLWHVPLLISIRIKLHTSFSQVKLEITCVCNLHVTWCTSKVLTKVSLGASCNVMTDDQSDNIFLTSLTPKPFSSSTHCLTHVGATQAKHK